MGIYINPPSMSKEEWLRDNATRITAHDVRHVNFSGDSLPVCVVDNGMFSAAGVAYCREEADVFLTPDDRPKQWYIVKRQKLRDVIPPTYFKLAGVEA